MKDSLYVKTHLDNVCNSIYPQSVESSQIHSARVDNMYWIYNNGNLRTDAELNLKIQNFKEELIAYEFANDFGIQFKIAEAKLKDLELLV